MHCPRGMSVILRPHTTLSDPGFLPLSSMSSLLQQPLNTYCFKPSPFFFFCQLCTETPFQTSKLRFAHNCSDNSPAIQLLEAGTECILMRCIIAQFNAFIHQPVCDSAWQFIFHPSPFDKGSRFHSRSLRH